MQAHREIMAAKLGVHPQTLKMWRLGRTEPGYANREKLRLLWQNREVA